MIFSYTPGGQNGDYPQDHRHYRATETEWIEARIDSGAFTSDSEYIRDSIRRDQDRQSEVDAIRGKLIQGEETGEPQAFNGDLFKEQMAAKHTRKVR